MSGRFTILLGPFLTLVPWVLVREVDDVANEGQAVGPWWERTGSAALCRDSPAQGEQPQEKTTDDDHESVGVGGDKMGYRDLSHRRGGQEDVLSAGVGVWVCFKASIPARGRLS